MAPDRREYQHFIPQFLLRNFAHPYVYRDAGGGGGGGRKRGRKRRYEQNKYPGSAVVNCLALSEGGFAADEAAVSRVCGKYDMYTQAAAAADRRRLETKFGGLEGKASALYRRIVAAHAAQRADVGMTRAEKDLLRKFFFLLKFRGGQFYQKYHASTAVDDYDDDDRELMAHYMRRKGFTRPIDVWYESLEAIIDVEMDADRVWERHLQTSIYFSHAQFFIDEVGSAYMTICTPESPRSEFILSENSYNVCEGPTIRFQDKDTGKYSSSCPRCHEFSPVSPRLMVVMRSQYLPEPTDDSIPDVGVRMQKQFMRQAFFGPGKSLLEDLPVRKATCNYQRMSNTRRIYPSGWKPPYDKNDRFSFPIFRISDHHVRVVNGLLLDHAFHGTSIVFNKEDTFLDTLEWFLTEPCVVGKNLGGEDQVRQQRYLSDLGKFMGTKGRVVQPIWNLSGEQEIAGTEASRVRNLACARLYEQMMAHGQDALVDRKHYERLGGTAQTWDEDSEQVSLMLSLWRAVDHHSGYLSGTVRRRNSILIMDAYKRLPCQRFWLYLKAVRYTLTTPLQRWVQYDLASFRRPVNVEAMSQEGPEDILTHG
ncbi:hypothetical protein GGS23DRAFT_460508 [Durotheca rogersii]|uniref:uncharacterized protein n=1 Tax=Durotheca rogersii TaxID=419775 RepID=UPI00221FDEDE|nr:uncharacterized protein GGS23DRAFT_460508 [Durotheca rogersii]KAI5864727.1 hypothetical protein GGS23DRAFT_460508 [Durotheca rogersii]